jgi:hypothetical protein
VCEVDDWRGDARKNFHAVRGHARESDNLNRTSTDTNGPLCPRLTRLNEVTAHTCTMTWTGCNRTTEKEYTYENWACVGHSMRLCSIRRTHYCSLENRISSWVDGQGKQCNAGDVADDFVSTQAGTSRIPGPWLEQKHTEGRHTRLHEGSISVGASVDGGGGPGRRRRFVAGRRRRRWQPLR